MFWIYCLETDEGVGQRIGNQSLEESGRAEAIRQEAWEIRSKASGSKGVY